MATPGRKRNWPPLTTCRLMLRSCFVCPPLTVMIFNQGGWKEFEKCFPTVYCSPSNSKGLSHSTTWKLTTPSDQPPPWTHCCRPPSAQVAAGALPAAQGGSLDGLWSPSDLLIRQGQWLGPDACHNIARSIYWISGVNRHPP